MAVTAGQSDLFTNPAASPMVRNTVPDDGGKLRIKRFTYTQSGAGDAASTVDLVKLPPGNVRVFPALSRITCSAFGASRVLDVGWTAYVDLAGAAVAADANDMQNDLDVSAAASAALTSTVTGDGSKLFSSQGGVTIQAVVAGGTIPDAATLTGYIVYAQE